MRKRIMIFSYRSSSIFSPFIVSLVYPSREFSCLLSSAANSIAAHRGPGRLREPLGRQQPMKNSEGTTMEVEGGATLLHAFFRQCRALRHPRGARLPATGIPSRHYLIVLLEEERRASLSLSFCLSTLTRLLLGAISWRT